MFFINDQSSEKVMTLGKFPDNTPKIEINIPKLCIWYKKHEVINIRWKYESMEELFILQVLVLHLREMELDNIFLDLFYVPTARMDRSETIKDVPLLRYFCSIINSLNLNEITICDPHSSVLPNLLNKCKIITPYEGIKIAIHLLELENIDIDYIFLPDAGSLKRYSPLLEKLHKPYITAYKHRDWQTGEIQKLEILKGDNDISGKNILIIDDICSKGGTFYYAGKALKELGANKLYLWVTHCEDSIVDGKLLTTDIIEGIFTSNSLLTKKHKKITTVNIISKIKEENGTWTKI